MTAAELDHWKPASEECLRFFGEMSATVSHEIRNKLAVINEKAGLIQDIASVMKSGRPVDPDRLEVQAGKIIDQIRQANATVRALNRLAHSVDELLASVDLVELVGLVTELSQRKAAVAEVTIAATGPTAGVSVTSNPILLENLVSVCIDVAIARVDAARALEITVEPGAQGAVVRFRRLSDLANTDELVDRRGPGPRALMAIVGARLTADDRGGELVLEINNHTDHESGSRQ
jgi:signal transduction histidine kinase